MVSRHEVSTVVVNYEVCRREKMRVVPMVMYACFIDLKILSITFDPFLRNWKIRVFPQNFKGPQNPLGATKKNKSGIFVNLSKGAFTYIILRIFGGGDLTASARFEMKRPYIIRKCTVHL